MKTKKKAAKAKKLGARPGRGGLLNFEACVTILIVCIRQNWRHPMADPLLALEAQRTKLLQQFLTVGDLRPGSVSALVRRCGKSMCHCAKPNDPGHEPQIRLTRKVRGKTVVETLSSPG